MPDKNRKPIVGITQGDGNGIGYEVIIKSLADARMLDSFTPIIYGSSKIFGFYKKLIHNIDNIDTYVISNAKEAKPKKVNIVNCLPDNVFVEPGKCTPNAAKGAISALKRALDDIKAGDIDVLVTAPICKKSLVDEGISSLGHMDFLKEEFKVDDVAMFMVSDQIRISTVTNHIPLREVPQAISIEKIVKKLRLMNESLKRDFDVIQPKIAVLGLNPHCGENGLLDVEEKEIILPAIKQASEEGILAFGPYSGDGFFGYGEYQRFDARHVSRSRVRTFQSNLFRGRSEFHCRPANSPHRPRSWGFLRHRWQGRSRPSIHDVCHIHSDRYSSKERSL